MEKIVNIAVKPDTRRQIAALSKVSGKKMYAIVEDAIDELNKKFLKKNSTTGIISKDEPNR